ncbi:MAG TPA: reverse transcriptase family protein, partial [Oculatellaceae cyanobacterium]
MSNECYVLSSLKEVKKQKIEHKGSEIIIEIQPAMEGDLPNIARCLLDTGSSGCILLNDFTHGYKASKVEVTRWMTKGGIYQTNKKCKVPFKLIEFDMQTTINWEFHIDETTKPEHSNYDMIIGRDLLGELGIDICFSTNTIQWRGVSVPMRDYGDLRSRHAVHLIYLENFESEMAQAMSSRVNRILDAKYEKADLVQLSQNCTHLSEQQQTQLLTLLQKYEDLFDGTLGEWKGTDIDIELQPNAKPYHAAPFPVPQVYEATLKKEVDRLVMLGVLERDNSSEWAAPTFIQPKKNMTVRFLSDFRKLNSMLKRKPYPIPKIQDMLQKLEGFQFASSIDLNMGYYTIRLNPNAQRICTIILPWGKYKYKRLPMGISGAPDIFQEKMSELMLDLEFVRTYLDDVLIVTKSTYEDHLNKLEIALKCIQSVGLKVNAEKSFFARTELEYLGHWVTREGVMPLANKVKAI